MIKQLLSTLFACALLVGYMSINSPKENQSLSEEEIYENENYDFSYLPDKSYYEDYLYYLPLINAIAKVESEGNPDAINSKGGDSGLLQQRKISVDDANRLSHLNFTYDDRFDPKKQIQMFLIIQRHYNPERDYQTASRGWNGHDYTCSDPRTEKYWKKVQSALESNYDYEFLWNDDCKYQVN